MSASDKAWKVFKWIFKFILKVIVTVSWGICHLLEMLFHSLAIWLKEFIK
jgi:hypothetical protein